MTDSFLQLIKDHLVKYPESVDSQLWNDRVQVLIHRVKEIEAERDKDKED